MARVIKEDGNKNDDDVDEVDLPIRWGLKETSLSALASALLALHAPAKRHHRRRHLCHRGARRRHHKDGMHLRKAGEGGIVWFQPRGVGRR